MNDYILKVSRLIGEIQQLAVLVHIQTEIKCKFEFTSHVQEIEFLAAPSEGVFDKRFDYPRPEELIESSFYIGVVTWNETEKDQQRTIKKLLKIKRFLKNALKEKRINYGALDYSIETVEYKRYVI
ncbi:hypothetical protein [Bacillus sp. Au-Bac7]|uniref:hypothetical protein n=1 Tax=Bacillus sp. Au-Bac7 TaxID=2906458 RepID=UPI001E403E01|nr:hypothetical protein [Bacillus sp. Au-Bac7]MCE4051990.1 hypothetical protein [Bacillus sp. Au-Bac7]